MNINDLKENWNKLGEHNAIDAILSGFENKHSENVIEDFFKTGKQETIKNNAEQVKLYLSI